MQHVLRYRIIIAFQAPFIGEPVNLKIQWITELHNLRVQRKKMNKKKGVQLVYSSESGIQQKLYAQNM